MNCFPLSCLCIPEIGDYATRLGSLVRVWASGQPGRGTYTDTVTRFFPNPKIPPFSPRYADQGGGKFPQGTRRVTMLSAAYTEDQVTGGNVPAGTEFYLIAGKHAYRLASEPHNNGVYWSFDIHRTRDIPDTPNLNDPTYDAP